jgi:two-component system sensor histidine kinase PilS (NtrC family)
MMPAPAPSLSPPIEQVAVPMSQTESGRRILWIVGIYRAVCGAALLGTALLLDLKVLGISTPNLFLTYATLYFIFGLTTFWIVQRETLPLSLPTLVSALLTGDILCIALVMVAGGSTGGSLPIPALPAARGQRLAAADADGVLSRRDRELRPARPRRVADAAGPGQRRTAVPDGTHRLRLLRHHRHRGRARPLHQGFGRARDATRHRRREPGAGQPADHQDMQDGVLVVDLNGVVRGHNAQVTRLLGGFGRMRGGMRLAEFSSTLHDYWRRWQEDYTEALPPFKVESTQAALARAPRAHRLRTQRRNADLPRGPGPRAERSAADEARGAGASHGVDRHEVRNPLSAINQAAQLLEEDAIVPPAGARLLGMIRNNARRIDRIVGEVLQLNRRDRQQPEVVTLVEFMQALIDEIVQAEAMPPNTIVVLIPNDVRVMFDRGHLNQIVWNLVRNAWQHCQKKEGSIRIAARPGYMGDAIICELADDGPGIPAELRPQIFEPFFTTRPGGTGLGLYIARELADANGAALELLPPGPGAYFRMTMKRAFNPVVNKR